jgi:hypothetical protein
MHDEGPEFQMRWDAWQQKNRLREKALKEKLKIIIPMVILLASAATGLYFFWPHGLRR